jgi:integrase
VTRNVVSLSDSIPVPRAATASLTPEQARLLVESAQEAREGPLWILALATGLRQSEALGLTWTDVDLDARTLRVERVLERVRDEYVLAEPKTQLSRRTLVLPAVAVEALTRQKAGQAAERLLAGRRWTGKWELVFTTTTGAPIDGVSLTKRFQRHLAELGLPRIRFHDLRHSAASLLAASGAGPADVMGLLGHSNVATTMNVYTHGLSAAQQAMAAEMDRVLGGS